MNVSVRAIFYSNCMTSQSKQFPSRIIIFSSILRKVKLHEFLVKIVRIQNDYFLTNRKRIGN